MARVFISYAHKDDSAFFEELKSNLQISEIDFWTDENISEYPIVKLFFLKSLFCFEV